LKQHYDPPTTPNAATIPALLSLRWLSTSLIIAGMSTCFGFEAYAPALIVEDRASGWRSNSVVAQLRLTGVFLSDSPPIHADAG